MIMKFIEATNGFNWGKFAVGRFDEEEWRRPSVIGLDRTLLGQRGWTPHHLLVLDLETGEGAMFRPGGYAPNDLQKHKIWVCPLFPELLGWLYLQDLTNLETLPPLVLLSDAPAAFCRGQEV